VRKIFGYTYTDHTADAGFIAWSDSIEGVFELSTYALLNLIIDSETVIPTQSQQIEIYSDRTKSLLIDFLSKIKDIVQFEEFVIKEINNIRIMDNHLQAVILGEPIYTEKHLFLSEIKRVTSHDFILKRYPNGFWKARVVLDL